MQQRLPHFQLNLQTLNSKLYQTNPRHLSGMQQKLQTNPELVCLLAAPKPFTLPLHQPQPVEEMFFLPTRYQLSHSGYHLKGNICIVNSLVCNLTHILKGCLFSSNDKCITCAPNFDLVSGRCRETILPNCLTVNNSMCSVCELFYVAAAGMCLNDNAKSIAGCLRAEGRGCVECSPGYTLGNSTCVQDVRPVFLRRFR